MPGKAGGGIWRNLPSSAAAEWRSAAWSQGQSEGERGENYPWGKPAMEVGIAGGLQASLTGGRVS